VSTDAPVTQTLEAVRRARAQRTALARRVLPFGLLSIAFISVQTKPHPGWHGDSLLVLLSVGCILVAAAGMLLRGWIRVPLLLLLVGSATLLWAQPNGPGFVGLLFTVVFAVRMVRGRFGGGLTVLGGIVFATALLLDAAGVHVHRNAVPIASVLAVLSIAVTAFFGRRIRQQEQQADQMLLELERTRGADLRAAALAERQRLAREMHDVLAHSLSGLLVQLEGARLLAAGDPGADPRIGSTIERAHHLAKNGLDEARRAISMLRGDELPGAEGIQTMASEFERDSGIPCTLVTTGQQREVGSETKLALYRVAQEALTNIRKHAHPERVEMSLDYLPDEVSLTVADIGAEGVTAPGAGSGGGAAGQIGSAGSGLSGDGSGYGLTGMRERAELLGGTLTAGPTGYGFRVQLRVPG
jgi:signal transduction histidine kinase